MGRRGTMSLLVVCGREAIRECKGSRTVVNVSVWERLGLYDTLIRIGRVRTIRAVRLYCIGKGGRGFSCNHTRRGRYKRHPQIYKSTNLQIYYGVKKP